ncbi:MAG TPA: HIT family protein [Anaeromyxobacteraceae bacterium]|nr:HIT family protein [Anaeromyxobacteraceae bacterium]
MPECLFCQIVRGAAAAEVVHEDPAAVAFLDAYPAARAHVLVVPRVHAPTLLDLPEAAVGALFSAVRTVQAKVERALHPVGMNVGWNHGRACGQHVLHLHVHVLPRFEGGGRGIQALGAGGDRAELSALASAIRAG